MDKSILAGIKTVMWFNFVNFALGDPAFRAAFEAETGLKAPPPARTALEQMVDEATGVKLDYVKRFVVWATETHWGEEEAPEIYFEKFKEGERGDDPV